MRVPHNKVRYPIVHIDLDDIGYYWEHTKIRAADYKAYLMQTDMELQLLDGTASGELREVYRSIARRGLINPLVVTVYQGRIYVVVGCQRLAALRALRVEKKIKPARIPCRIVEDFDEEIVNKFHPNKIWRMRKALRSG
jgi:hypothetical protein